ncbi:MAG: ATP-binding cassette domain-containing protein [Phycisphaerales bacterium]
MTDAIRIADLHKSFGDKRAVQGMDLVVPEGSLHGFIGPNGAGKTTTIRMIMSIIFPDTGELSVLGKKSAVESKDRIGYLPEERGVYKKMKVLPFIKYMAKLKGVTDSGLDKKAKQWLERVGLSDVSQKKCEELSKGMQQKVQFIASVIHEPELLILDEPFSGLDPVNMRLLRDLIREINEKGTTIIFSTHVMAQAEQLCDNIVMIHKGEKVLDDPLDAIRSRFDPRALLFEPMDRSISEQDLIAIEGVTHAEQEGDSWAIQLEDGLAPADAIAKLASQIQAMRVEVKRPSLEDIFVEIVEDDFTTGELAESLGAAS